MLIRHFRRLPGIGRRTAERLALALLDWRDEELRLFGDEIAALRERIVDCQTCGNLSDGPSCAICRAANRDTEKVCVVELAAQIPMIESSGSYRGLYHVLGGRIVPLEGKGPEDLRIDELHKRVEGGAVQELILATSPDVEGEATASFLAAEFEKYAIRITRIASGVPVGADLSYADAATLAMAIHARRPLH
jgi:recombination protein RecR